MSLYKFRKNDKLINYVKTYPSYKFSVKESAIYLNDQNSYSGSFTDEVTEVPSGYISLYEMNVDRDFSAHSYDPETGTGTKTRIYPFITKDSNFASFSTVGTTAYSQFSYGAELTGTYPLSASISRESFLEGTARTKIVALKNTLNYYAYLNNHYEYSSSTGLWDKDTERLNLISVPAIFFGHNIKKGSVQLDYYISGSLIGRLQDVYKDGSLIQTTGSTYAQSQGSGSIAGVVLYNEGFVLLSGSWDLSTDSFNLGAASEEPKWVNFAVGCNDGFTSVANVTPSASFDIFFSGSQTIPSVTLFAHAKKGELNFSSNPTFLDKADVETPFTYNSSSFSQPEFKIIKNTISSSFAEYEASFKKQTFISKIGIYDEERNLIAIAHLARPIRKRETDDYTFKLKLDI